MNKKKLYTLDEFEEDDFSLLAIHSSLENYKVAFLLNTYCDSQFIMSKEDIELPLKNAFFQNFEWNNPKKGIHCNLFSNKFTKLGVNKSKGPGLFDIPETKKVYLLPELKKVDYFIKINLGISVEVLSKKIKLINEISMCYTPKTSKINFHHTLNFD